jgi:hypothetical protein
MKRWKKLCILFLTICLLNLFLTGTVFSQQNYYAKADITKNRPVIKSMPEEKIPVEVIKEPEKKGGNKWLWAILGVVAVGGLAAAAGGGGGGGGGGSSDNGESATGDVTVSW